MGVRALALAVACLCACGAAAGQQNEAQKELARRVQDAQAARTAGDAQRAAKANTRVVALALRELGQVRLLEGAYAQAGQLYRRSLEFEDDPNARVDLAIAEVGAFDADGAIADSERVLAVQPDDLRALTTAGRAWSLKKDYSKAAEYLERVAERAPSVETLYSLATCLLASKNQADRDRATEVFGRMTKLAGDSSSLHVMFGRAYRDAANMNAAVREFQRAIAMDPKTPHAHYFLGLARLSMNEWAPTPEASKELWAELENYPRDYLANYMLGFVLSLERKYDESNVHLKLAAEVTPNTPEPWLYLGLNAFAKGDLKAAEGDLRKAIEFTGENESRAVYQIRRAYVTLGRILSTTGRPEEAAKFAAKGRELQEKSLALSQQAVGAHLTEGGAGAAAVVLPLGPEEEQQAAPTIGKTADLFGPVDAQILAHSNLTNEEKQQADVQEQTLRTVLAGAFAELGTIAAIQKDYPAAEKQFQEAERWNSTLNGLHRNLGVAAYRGQDFPEAIRALTISLKERSSDPPIRAMLGLSYYASERYADAVSALKPLGEAGMRDPVAGYAWAASLAKLGDLKAASPVLTEVQKNDLPAETWLLVGQLWISIEDYNQAIAALQRALAMNPSLPRVHYFAGLAYLRGEKHAQAAEEFHAELVVNPDDFEAKDNLGFVYLQQSRTEEAAALYREVIAAHPDNATAHYQLGKIFLDRGQTGDAISHLELAAKQSPDTDYIHYQLQAAYRKASRTTDADREMEIYKAIKARKRASTAPASMGENP